MCDKKIQLTHALAEDSSVISTKAKDVHNFTMLDYIQHFLTKKQCKVLLDFSHSISNKS